MSVVESLILSTFSGGGGLDRGFEIEMPGGCIVRAPEKMMGGDIRGWHVPGGFFDGVIGGPPCKPFSDLAAFIRWRGGEVRHPNLIPEFERIVREARPRWFLMENVPKAPIPQIEGYHVTSTAYGNNRWYGGVQDRGRIFSFSVRKDLAMERPLFELLSDASLFENPERTPTVTGGHSGVGIGRGKGYWNPTIAEMCRLQGFPEDFLADSPFTAHGKREVIGNSVPLDLACAVARAVRRALAEMEAMAA